MTQHFYGDVSNLNAPYDAIAIQGYNTGMGAVTYEGKTLPSVGFPWMEESNDTLEVQYRFNAALKSRDYCPLLADGVLGPRTCGAMYTLEDLSAPDGMVATCSQHVAEANQYPPKVCPGGVVPDAPAQEEQVERVQPKKAGIPMWVWGAGIAAVAIGAAIMLKKKR